MVPLHMGHPMAPVAGLVRTQLRFGGAKTKRVPILDYAPLPGSPSFLDFKIPVKTLLVVVRRSSAQYASQTRCLGA